MDENNQRKTWASITQVIKRTKNDKTDTNSGGYCQGIQ